MIWPVLWSVPRVSFRALSQSYRTAIMGNSLSNSTHLIPTHGPHLAGSWVGAASYELGSLRVSSSASPETLGCGTHPDVQLTLIHGPEVIRCLLCEYVTKWNAVRTLLSQSLRTDMWFTVLRLSVASSESYSPGLVRLFGPRVSVPAGCIPVLHSLLIGVLRCPACRIRSGLPL